MADVSLTIACFALVWFALAPSSHLLSVAEDDEVSVELEAPVWVVSDKFLSLTIDAGSIRRREWEKFNFTTPKMLNLARALSPAMLRVGGTSQDYLVFQKSLGAEYKIKESSTLDILVDFNMTIEDWDAMNQFVKLAGWDFIFGLNVLLRKSDGSWDSGNARDLLEYTLSKGYPVSWELGNEPDMFKGDDVVSFEQLAKDFESLKQLLGVVKLMPEYVAGPDVATLGRNGFFNGFLSSVKPGILNAITWHHYYTNEATAVLPDMFSADLLDVFIGEAESARDYVAKYFNGTELWLGETSSCYGGGAPILSSSFVSGFMWLDKLGVTARTNHSRVFRQDYIGGSYSLLDSEFNPLPDYWLSVLHKRLVGEKVLNVSNGLEKGRKVRVYAHCAQKPAYPAGDVVLFILNTHTFDTMVTVKTSSLAGAQRDVYWLSPPGISTNVLSREVALNGKVLALISNTTLPDLTPVKQEPSNTIQLPALTFGFYVFRDVKANACM